MRARNHPARLRVRYDKRIGIACLAAAIVLGALAAISGHVTLVGALAPVWFCGFGVVFLTRPYALVDGQELIVYALIGSGRETYRLEGGDAVAMEGKHVFLIRNGTRRKVALARWIADKRDWAALRDWGERRTQA